MKQRRVAVFGGAFDPPHNAHLYIAEKAMQHYQLDELIWLPTAQPAHKASCHASFKHRCAMLSCLLTGQANWTLDERENQRSGPSYSIDSYREIAQEQQRKHANTQLLSIIGADQLATLPQWHDYEALFQWVSFIVVPRGPQDIKGILNQLGMLERSQTESDVPQPITPGQILCLEIPKMQYSSTSLRQNISQNQGIPTIVASYIQQHQLY